MARGRMINTTVAVDRRLNTLSLESHLLYMMTVPHLDRDGLIAGDVDLLTSTAIPRRRELHDRAEELIQEWLTCGLVLAYETDDTRVLFFQGFRKNNKIQYNKEGASQFPPPPGYHRTDDGLEEDAPAPNSRPTLELVQSNAGVTPELPTVKVKGREEEEKVNESSDPIQRAIVNAYDACGLMTSRTHIDKHLETIKRTGLPAWQLGFAEAHRVGKSNFPNYVARCAESAMLAEQQRGNGHSKKQPAEQAAEVY